MLYLGGPSEKLWVLPNLQKYPNDLDKFRKHLIGNLQNKKILLKKIRPEVGNAKDGINISSLLKNDERF
jgi:hypothetical protein